MARIAIDATAFDAVSPGSGQHRYTVDLVRGLSRLATTDTFLLFGSRPDPVPELADLFAAGGAWQYRQLVPTTGRGAAYRDQLRWAVALRRAHVDLLHALHTAVPLVSFAPVVATVYDLMYELFPDYAEAVQSRPYRLYRWSVKRKVERVIAISETTAADLGRLWGVPRARIDVVHLGSDLGVVGEPGAALSALARDSALLVSPYNLEPRKNLLALLEATAIVRRAVPHVRLVLFGDAAVTPERTAVCEREIARLGLQPAIVRTGLLSRGELAWLYARTAVFVFPSLYEGFGLPLLEAMRAGACVLARSGSAMAEVTGDAGALVETKEPDAMAQALIALLGDPERRRALGARAQHRAATFTVERMAQGTYASYCRALGRS